MDAVLFIIIPKDKLDWHAKRDAMRCILFLSNEVTRKGVEIDVYKIYCKQEAFLVLPVFNVSLCLAQK